MKFVLHCWGVQKVGLSTAVLQRARHWRHEGICVSQKFFHKPSTERKYAMKFAPAHIQIPILGIDFCQTQMQLSN